MNKVILKHLFVLLLCYSFTNWCYFSSKASLMFKMTIQLVVSKNLAFSKKNLGMNFQYFWY